MHCTLDLTVLDLDINLTRTAAAMMETIVSEVVLFK